MGRLGPALRVGRGLPACGEGQHMSPWAPGAAGPRGKQGFCGNCSCPLAEEAASLQGVARGLRGMTPPNGRELKPIVHVCHARSGEGEGVHLARNETERCWPRAKAPSNLVCSPARWWNSSGRHGDRRGDTTGTTTLIITEACPVRASVRGQGALAVLVEVGARDTCAQSGLSLPTFPVLCMT